MNKQNTNQKNYGEITNKNYLTISAGYCEAKTNEGKEIELEMLVGASTLGGQTK